MTSKRFLFGAATLALVLPMAAPSFGANFGPRGGGGAHVSAGAPATGSGGRVAMGGGGRAAMGARVGGAPAFTGGGARFSRATANSFAAASPRTAAVATGGTWTGGRQAWNGGRTWTGTRQAWNGGWRGDGFHRRAFLPDAAIAAGVGIGSAYAYYGGPDYYDYGPDYSDTYYDTGYDTGYYGYGPAAVGYNVGPAAVGYEVGPTETFTYDTGPSVAVTTGAVGGDASYCAQRFRSYDPASGTYLGFDGQRHPCP